MSTITTGRMTVEEFERIEDSLDDDQVELIDGYIVRMDEMKPPHVLASELLRDSLQPMIPAGRYIREDKPVQIPDYDQLRPDIAVVRGNPRVYAKRHPMPEDISLLIEISDTTLSKDRKQKLPSYARSGIQVYWIVNVIERQVELYTQPVADQYGSKLVFTAGQSVPVIIDGVEVGHIAVDDFMPEIEPAAESNGD
jgi:Uma2 family endonuclease